MATVELSDKALQLVEKRRGEWSIDQYVNMVLENVFDKTSQGPSHSLALFDIIETRIMSPAASTTGAASTASAASAASAASTVSNGKIPEVIKVMKNTYSGKIPYNLFYQECIERGIPSEEVEAAVHKYRGLFQIQLNKDDEYAKVLLVIIYDYLKDIYSASLSTSQFYGKCLEEGLTVDDIRFAENAWQISIPDVTTLKDLATKTDAMSIENKLLKLFYAIKKEYPDTIPTAVLHRQCIQFGLTKEEVGQLEKVYTRYLLSKHNEKISSKKEEAKVDVKSMIKSINTKIRKVLDELIVLYGENVPAMAFSDKCKAQGFTGEELAYARRVFEDYLTSLSSYKEIKYMNNKAYIILTSLRKTYPGKIPYNIFYTKCKAIGMKTEEIAEAIRQSGQIISTEKSDEEHYLKVLEDILVEQKK